MKFFLNGKTVLKLCKYDITHLVLIRNNFFLFTSDFNVFSAFIFNIENMHTVITNLVIFLCTIFTLIEVRPVTKIEQSLIRHRRLSSMDLIDDIWQNIQPALNDHFNSHLNASSKSECERKPYIDDDYIEYCREKILNPDGRSYSLKTNGTLYKSDGTIIPLHQAESNIELETYNHSN